MSKLTGWFGAKHENADGGAARHKADVRHEPTSVGPVEDGATAQWHFVARIADADAPESVRSGMASGGVLGDDDAGGTRM